MIAATTKVINELKTTPDDKTNGKEDDDIEAPRESMLESLETSNGGKQITVIFLPMMST